MRAAILLVLVGCGQSAISSDDGGVDAAHDARVCPKPTQLVQSSPLADFAVDATDVYWLQSEPSLLVRTPKTGGANTLLATDVDAFTLDSDAIYYDAFTYEGGISHEIFRLAKAGGGPPSVIAATKTAAAELFVDATTLYFVNDAAVNAVPKTGGTPQAIVSGPPHVSSLVGIDATSVYWISSETTSATIWSTPKAGGPSVQLAQVGGIMRAVLDSGAIYFTTDARDLEKLVIATSSITVLATGFGTYGGETLAVHSGTAFVDEQDMGQYPAIILAVPTDGGVAVDTCAGGSMAVVQIAADDTTIYWGLVYEGLGQILSKPL